MCDYREKKDNKQPLESEYHGSPATTAEKEMDSLPQESRLPCSNCRSMGFKCQAAGNELEGEERCQRCIDRDFISCEDSSPKRPPWKPKITQAVPTAPPTSSSVVPKIMFEFDGWAR